MSPSAAVIAAVSDGGGGGGDASLLISADLPSGHLLYGGINLDGIATNDIMIGQSGGNYLLPMGIKIETDGTLTFGSPVAVPDPDTNGPTHIDSYSVNGVTGWFTSNTLDDAVTVQLRKFVVDPDDASASQQDMYSRTYTAPYSATFQVNRFINALVDAENYNSAQVIHEHRVLHYDETGFGDIDFSTLDTTGLVGNDFSFTVILSQTRYWTSNDRTYEVASDGTVITQPFLGHELDDYWNANDILGRGVVENYVLSSLEFGLSDQLLEVGLTDILSSTPLTDFFGAGEWYGHCMWHNDDKVYLGATSPDGTIGRVAEDLFGVTPIIHNLVDSGNQCIPVGMTTRGEFITMSPGRDHYAIFEPA